MVYGWIRLSELVWIPRLGFQLAVLFLNKPDRTEFSSNRTFDDSYLVYYYFILLLFSNQWCFIDPTRIEVDRRQVDVELVERVLSTNICVDERGEARSAPLLLRYEPQVKSFLEGPTVSRSQAIEVQPAPPTWHNRQRSNDPKIILTSFCQAKYMQWRHRSTHSN